MLFQGRNEKYTSSFLFQIYIFIEQLWTLEQNATRWRMREERNCSTCKLNPIHRTDINIFKYFGGEEVNDGFEIPHFVRLFR